MLIPIKQRISEDSIQELLSYAIFPDPERIEQEIVRYHSEAALELYGHEEDDEIIGIVGFIVHPNNKLELRHIAVKPEERSKGYGRGLILQLLEAKQPAIIEAETDEDSVDFYRNVGFSVISLGEKFPGVERFKCIFEVELEE
ncbi:N-acetyltransferase [Paenibacillus psychroresistens]|uniref:N-acetyltransferase n=1 Tax=Paenibacillus psychroresistens TaxID=1778678 RepID=A0A6B8RHX4_9BACL|nr:GNAT family N-acetyltransferase [Paenibacillus psychroresistens]QGQ95344.1 N-acetyltransferase [Paenibacillus psychroresistens]